MANVLTEEKKQQVLALGRLGCSLRQIQKATRIRRETAAAMLWRSGRTWSTETVSSTATKACSVSCQPKTGIVANISGSLTRNNVTGGQFSMNYTADGDNIVWHIGLGATIPTRAEAARW